MTIVFGLAALLIVVGLLFHFLIPKLGSVGLVMFGCGLLVIALHCGTAYLHLR